jgi:hypothetical protein
LLSGHLVQRHYADRHDRASHYGESRITSHTHNSQGSQSRFWQLQLQCGKSIGQKQKVFAVVRQAAHGDFQIGANKSIQG